MDKIDIVTAEPGQLTVLKQAVFPHETGDYVLEPNGDGSWSITFFPIDESPSVRTWHEGIRPAMYYLVSKGASEFGQGGKS